MYGLSPPGSGLLLLVPSSEDIFSALFCLLDTPG